MIVLAVTWIAKPGKEEAAAELFRALTEESRREPGCLLYQVHRHKTDPTRFFIYEQYRDERALDLHRNSPHFLEYARNQLPKIAERRDGDLYDPL
jgi:(4S)-4-hydroxy-5-phosphonooxypentane-2,3-dione isomerase